MYLRQLNKEARTANTGLAKVAVQCSADTFVVNQSLVLRINICGENRHLRQAQNRCRQFFQTRQPNRKFNMNQDIFNVDRDYFLTLNWTFRRWTASPALKDKSVGGNTTLFTGQKYDNRYTEYIEDGWTHDHCEICKSYLTESDEINEQYGYTDNYHTWLCYECYRKHVTNDFVINEFLLSDIVELSNDRVVLFVRPLVIGIDFRVTKNSKFGNVEIIEHLDIPRKILDNGLQDFSTFTLVLKNKWDKDKLVKDNLYKLTD